MSTPLATAGRSFSLAADCDAVAVRAACVSIRAWLAEAGLTTEELDTWELVLAEAGTNAARYAPPARQSLPVAFDVLLQPTIVEVRLTDHTAGFDLPEHVELPPRDSEHGRGLYLIKSLTDSAQYLRGRGENCFVLRKRRSQPAPAGETPSAAALRAELAESQSTLDLMTEELASAFESLSAVFRFSAALTGHGNPEDFARKWLEELLTTVQADWFVFRLAGSGGTELRLAAHAGGIEPTPIYLVDPAAGEDAPVAVRAALSRRDVWFDATNPRPLAQPGSENFPTGCGFSHPIVINEHLVGVVTFGRHDAAATFKAAQVNVIETFADFLGFQIRNAQLQEERMQTRLFTRELEIAAGIQHSLLPARLPEPGGFHLASHYRSARQVGGDYYDALTTPGGGILLVMADVMGKGVPAAMFATVFRTLVHARHDLAATPGRFLSWVNRNLATELGRVDMFLTAQLAFIDPGARQLCVAGAGHPPLLLTDPSGQVRALESGGPPIGIVADMDYPEETLPLPLGARVLLYTDGFNEARNATGEFLGMEAWQHYFGQTAVDRLPVNASRDRLLEMLTRFEAGTPQADDQAFILLIEELR